MKKKIFSLLSFLILISIIFSSYVEAESVNAEIDNEKIDAGADDFSPYLGIRFNKCVYRQNKKEERKGIAKYDLTFTISWVDVEYGGPLVSRLPLEIRNIEGTFSERWDQNVFVRSDIDKTFEYELVLDRDNTPDYSKRPLIGDEVVIEIVEFGNVHWSPKSDTCITSKPMLYQDYELSNRFQNIKNWFWQRFNIIFKGKIIDNFLQKINPAPFSNSESYDFNDLVENVIIDHEKNYRNEGITYKKYYAGAKKEKDVAYYKPNEVIVCFRPSIDVSLLDNVQGFPIVKKFPLLNSVIVEVNMISEKEFINKISQNEDVFFAEYNLARFLIDSDSEAKIQSTSNDPLLGDQWGLHTIKAPEAWGITKADSSVLIAVLDTGIDYNHDDLKDHCPYKGYDYVNNDNDAMDDEGHGTQMAGIMAACINNGIGIAGVSNAALYPIKVLDNQGEGFADDVVEGLIHIVEEQTVDIITMCFGSPASSLLEDITYRIVDREGLLMISGVGNNGYSDQISYPAGYKKVVAVGSVNHNLVLCRYSGDWGSNYNSQKKEVDLVAPGLDITTTDIGNSYTTSFGTGASAAFVAGVAALFYCSPHGARDPDKCKDRMFSTAKDLYDVGKDVKYGYGLLDAYKTVKKEDGIQKATLIL